MSALVSPLNHGALAAAVRSGTPTLGTFIGTASPIAAEVCAAAGVDWVLLDLEHGAGGEEQVRDVVPAAGSYGVPTVVRVESAARIRMGRVLDSGAAGIMLPRMNTADEVTEAVRHLRYPPAGDRGVATYNRSCRFGLDPDALDRANSEVLGVVQIESAVAVGHAEAIAALDGVDVLFVGPRDLSHDLGVPGDLTAPAFTEAIAHVLAAGRRHGKACGLLVADGAAAARRLEQGWSFVGIGSDSTLLAAAVTAEFGRARTSVKQLRPDDRNRSMRTTDDGWVQPGIGLISVGWMGKLHSRAYQAVPLVYPELKIRPRLVHAADTAADRAGYAHEVLGYARTGTDYHDVLADPDVDVVSICAPNMLHREIGVAAARAGKPFWIEKPVGRDAAETAGVAAAARAAGVTTSIGYNYRHVPAVERVRELIAAGRLGRVTNVRAVFFNSYAAEPNGALSWRFRRDEAGSGALGDLLSHVVDLMQYVVAPITEVSSLLSTVYAQRPILPMGSGTHFAVIENGELGEVENDDYVAALIRFGTGSGSRAAGAVGTLEASRVSVGPQCALGFEIYGTEGSAIWNFEQMNELRLCLGRGGDNAGYTTVLGNAALGDYGRFQPGPGTSMSYDDLKVIEAKKFLVAVCGGERRNSTIEEAHADAEVIAATAASARDGAWHKVAPVPGATFGHA